VLSSADLHDAVFPYLLHLTFATSHTPLIFTITLLSTLFAIPLLSLIPLRPLFLVGGLAPFALSHPLTQHTLTQLLPTLPLSRWRARLTRVIDDDKLKDRHWQSELREVELFENERWLPGEGAEWGRANLKAGERVAWTRGRDGWSNVKADGSGDVRWVVAFSPWVRSAHTVTAAISHSHSSLDGHLSRRKTGGPTLRPNGAQLVRMIVSVFPVVHTAVSLMFSVSPPVGWVYTNDAWLEPHASPLGEWKAQGAMTRRRRWVRRIYLSPVVPAMS
jgi:hypothetical protein